MPPLVGGNSGVTIRMEIGLTPGLDRQVLSPAHCNADLLELFSMIERRACAATQARPAGRVAGVETDRVR